jgi:formate-dependent nitrite reductase membrane component NrfD
LAEHHWGWLIAIYLFLGGMGAGSFLIASVFELSGLRYKYDFCPTSLAGAGVSGPLILIGTVLLIFDLGAGMREPWRIPLMFLNFSSVMTWGIWILSLFLPLCFLYAALELMHVEPGILAWLQDRQKILPKRLRLVPETLPYRRLKLIVCSAGCLFAVGTAVYTGVLLAVVEAVPFWNSPVLPVLFLVSAVSTGMGLSFDLAATMAVPDLHDRYGKMPIVHMSLIGLEVALLALLMILAIAKGGEAMESARMILTGSQSVVFWVLVIGLGMVYPFAFHAYAYTRHKHSFVPSLLAGAGIVVAGLFVRYLVVASAIPLTL